MGSVYLALNLFITIIRTENSESRLMGYSVLGKNQLKVYRKDLFWGPSYSIYFLMTFFFLLKETEICNYADDTTAYVCGHELEQIASSLEIDVPEISKWFFDNKMKLNPDKCHLLIFGAKNADVSVKIGETIITESVEEKLLGITLDKNLNFKSHINQLCSQAGQKLHALARISNYVDSEKLKIMMNTFIISQFSYCPLI